MPHINEKIDFTAEVFVVFGNKVLLRKHDKYGLWLSVGGHVELDEDPNEAAVREVKEEVGLNVELYHKNRLFAKNNDTYHELIPPVFMNRHTISPTHEHVTLTYFATSKTDQTIPDDKKEVSAELKWFSLEELNSAKYEISDSIKFYAKEALQRLMI